MSDGEEIEIAVEFGGDALAGEWPKEETKRTRQTLDRRTWVIGSPHQMGQWRNIAQTLEQHRDGAGFAGTYTFKVNEMIGPKKSTQDCRTVIKARAGAANIAVIRLPSSWCRSCHGWADKSWAAPLTVTGFDSFNDWVAGGTNVNIVNCGRKDTDPPEEGDEGVAVTITLDGEAQDETRDGDPEGWLALEVKRTRSLAYPEERPLDPARKLGFMRNLVIETWMIREATGFKAGYKLTLETKLEGHRLSVDNKVRGHFRGGKVDVHSFVAPGLAMSCHDWTPISFEGEMPIEAYAAFDGFAFTSAVVRMVSC